MGAQGGKSGSFGTSLHGEPARFRAGYTPVGTDTWAWLQPNGDLGESNSGLILDGEHALLIDTLWDLRLTRRMLNCIPDLAGGSPALPQTVINTHSDGDHFWGNELLPQAEFICAKAAREMMPRETPSELHRLSRSAKVLGAFGRLPLPIVGTLRVPGLPRLPASRMASMLQPFHFEEVTITMPSRTFEDRIAISVGRREVEAIMVGPAHTVGDTIVWVPDVSVCFAADVLFVDITPVVWAGPIKSFIAALDQVLALDADVYVPGHGPVSGREEVELAREYFDWVEQEACSRLARGDSAAKTTRALLLSDEFESLPWSRWDNPATLMLSLHTEEYVRAGGTGHLPKKVRSQAVLRMQLLSTELERRRGQGA